MAKPRTDKSEDFLAQARELREVADEAPGELLPRAEQMGINSRKAYYLVEIDRVLDRLPQLPRDKLRKVKWTKAQIIADGLDESNWRERLDLATRLTVQELKDRIKHGTEVPKKKCVLFYFSDDDYEALRSVLKEYGARDSARGLSDKEGALMRALMALNISSGDDTDH